MDKNYFIGCDIGTGSVRAGIFDESGSMLAQQTHPIQMWRPEPDFAEQSSEDVWKACCACINEAVKQADIDSGQIKGIGFDATCSLVVLGKDDRPLSVSPTGADEQNIMVWMDHRAIKQAERINQTRHEVLRYVGGSISPEMQTPKLLWLKTHKPETWKKATKFFDLADYLVYRATGEDVRSMCTTTCKWTYLGHENKNTGSDTGTGRWDDSFFTEIGLEDLVKENYERIGQRIRPVGEAVGEGLNDEAAKALGLSPGTSVGVAIIDAHAGGLGLLGMQYEGKQGNPPNMENRLALIGGTSSCHMAVSKQAKFIDGVWGPYYSAMIPEMWLTEGGQSATGSLIDHIIFSSEHSIQLKEHARQENKTVYQLLNERLYELVRQKGLSHMGTLTRDLHVLPYFHGNRSPRADPSLVGSICGLKLSSTPDDMALLYLATIQAIAYGTRHIIHELNENGYSIDTIMATGGGTKNEVFLQQHADICGCPLVLPKEPEAVLLGSAIAGAVASGVYPTIYRAMEKMNRAGRVIRPSQEYLKDYHDAKYEVFHHMYRDEVSYFETMDRING